MTKDDMRLPSGKRILWLTLMLFGRYLLPSALFIGISGALVAFGVYLGRSLYNLDKSVAPGSFAAVATILATVGAVVVGKYLEKRHEIASQHRAQKIDFYKEFLKDWFDLLQDYPKKGNTPGSGKARSLQQRAVDLIGRTARDLILWGNREVIASFLTVRDFAASTEAASHSDPKILLYFEDFLLAVRSDLGHTNRGLKRGDLLRLFITDVDKILRR